MAPSAISSPPSPIEPTTSQLTESGIKKAISHTAPSLSKTPSQDALPELDASLLTETLRTDLVPLPTVPGQKSATDHMLSASWSFESGWSAPTLYPYGPLSLPPTASCLHYATECFEGLKLYRGYDGKLRLFRPSLNCARMLLSATRVALPAFPPAELEKLIIALASRDGTRWLPKDQPGQFLYIRPTIIGTDADVGVKPPGAALMYVFLTTLPNIAQAVVDRPQPGLKLLASEDDACRAWPGGFGYAKVGANYGPSMVAQREAAARGYDQILWLFGPEGQITEAGASNFFVVWEAEDGAEEVVTAPLEGKLILNGVTRRSTLDLLRERCPHLRVTERDFTMEEVSRKAQQGKLKEAFAVGTAYFVAPVSSIGYKGQEIRVPMSEGKSGKVAGQVKTWLEGITYGKDGFEDHEWGVVVPEKA
jgi:branched-chain amino acid aminotransferase